MKGKDKVVSIYKFIDINEYRKSKAEREEAISEAHDLWEDLAKDFSFD
mgnify:CR=1 FL=1